MAKRSSYARTGQPPFHHVLAALVYDEFQLSNMGPIPTHTSLEIRRQAPEEAGGFDTRATPTVVRRVPDFGLACIGDERRPGGCNRAQGTNGRPLMKRQVLTLL